MVRIRRPFSVVTSGAGMIGSLSESRRNSGRFKIHRLCSSRVSRRKGSTAIPPQEPVTTALSSCLSESWTFRWLRKDGPAFQEKEISDGGRTFASKPISSLLAPTENGGRGVLATGRKSNCFKRAESGSNPNRPKMATLRPPTICFDNQARYLLGWGTVSLENQVTKPR